MKGRGGPTPVQVFLRNIFFGNYEIDILYCEMELSSPPYKVTVVSKQCLFKDSQLCNIVRKKETKKEEVNSSVVQKYTEQLCS